MDTLALKKTANEVRKGIVTAVHSAKSGHPGGSLSAADILTYLYFEEMNIDPEDPKKADRDRFVLSKGHIAPGFYSTLANRGFFPVEDLTTLRHTGSYLQGHPDMKHIPGVDMSSGSLGQGISAAVGMALSAKIDNASYRVYTLLGDGELQEGQVWEASMFAGAKNLDNLVVIVDNNGLQIDGKIDDVCSPYPIADKFKAFNFNVIDTLGISRYLDPQERYHNLTVLMERYQINWDEDKHHRADYDSEGTSLVLYEMLKKLEDKNIITLSDLSRIPRILLNKRV